MCGGFTGEHESMTSGKEAEITNHDGTGFIQLDSPLFLGVILISNR